MTLRKRGGLKIMGILRKTTKKGAMKKQTAKVKAPVAKPERALEHIDGSGFQTSTHPMKSQSRIMRFIKR